MVGPGSSYHLTSLRYAKPSASCTVSLAPLANGDDTGRSRRIDRLFEKAEEDYRAGESSSSSLLIRSNVVPLEVKSTNIIDVATDIDANEGFLRTKARSLLAQSVHLGETDSDDAISSALIESGGSIYLPRRRARNPLSRDSYEDDRRKRRLVKDRAREKAKREKASRDNAADEEGQQGSDHEQILQQDEISQEARARIQHGIQSIRDILPSGSFLETIHYLASHYYDARGNLSTGSVYHNPISRQDINETSRNLFRAYEGNALVALGIYLEELAKYEISGKGASAETLPSDQNGAIRAQQKLLIVREQMRRMRRRKPFKDNQRARTILAESNWAIVPRQSRKRKASQSATLSSFEGGSEEDSEGSGESDGDATSVEKKQDGEEARHKSESDSGSQTDTSQ